MKKQLTSTNKVETKELTTSAEDFRGKISVEIKNVVDEWSDNENLIPLQISNSELLEERKMVDNVLGVEGELLISKNRNTIVNVDVNGDLIISDEYADCFSINDQGELIFER